MKYALDTNIVSYYLKGNSKIIEKVDSEAENNNIIIPPFVYFEVKKWLVAVNSKNKLQAFEDLFNEYGIDSIDKKILDLSLTVYLKLRKAGIIVDDSDLIIAAYCIENNYILVSNNIKHFRNIENLQVVNWVE